MESHSSTAKKKAYSRPVLTKLTNEQAKTLIADRKHYSEKQAAEFLQALPHSLANKGKNQSGKLALGASSR